MLSTFFGQALDLAALRERPWSRVGGKEQPESWSVVRRTGSALLPHRVSFARCLWTQAAGRLPLWGLPMPDTTRIRTFFLFAS